MWRLDLSVKEGAALICNDKYMHDTGGERCRGSKHASPVTLTRDERCVPRIRHANTGAEKGKGERDRILTMLNGLSICNAARAKTALPNTCTGKSLDSASCAKSGHTAKTGPV